MLFIIILYVATHKRCEARIDAWLSLVERCVRDAEVAGSNPVASTLHFQGFRETETLIFLSSSNFVLTVAVYPLLMDYGIGSVDLIKLNRYWSASYFFRGMISFIALEISIFDSLSLTLA